MLTNNAARHTATPKAFFKCRNCDALYHIVKIEGGSESADREITCRACGGPLHSCFQELLGVKRAAYALLTGQTIDAKAALEYGMVNEVVPRDKLLQRAWQLADHIMTQPRTTRRMTTQIVRRPWRRQITDSLDGGFAIQMFAHLAKKKGLHSRDHIGSVVDYVRKGKKNNFD
jgi:hypothetical protein